MYPKENVFFSVFSHSLTASSSSEKSACRARHKTAETPNCCRSEDFGEAHGIRRRDMRGHRPYLHEFIRLYCFDKILIFTTLQCVWAHACVFLVFERSCCRKKTEVAVLPVVDLFYHITNCCCTLVLVFGNKSMKAMGTSRSIHSSRP